VNQHKYQCESVQKGWKPLPPIVFTVQGKEGINLIDAVKMNFSCLDNRDDAMFVSNEMGSSVSLRIDVRPHYRIGSN
jgi:hypothetical protein